MKTNPFELPALHLLGFKFSDDNITAGNGYVRRRNMVKMKYA